jgi:hypothetical protein
VCDHLSDIQFHFVRQYQYELVIDPDERARNAGRGGLCAFHTWLYKSISSPQGVCSGYSPVPLNLSATIEDLLNESAEPTPEELEKIVRKILSLVHDCLACELLNSAESKRLEEITANAEQLGKTPLCMPHLCAAILRNTQVSFASSLLEELATTLRRPGEDMQQFALKQSGLRYNWTSTGERAAHMNALRTIVGARPLSYIKTVVEI